MRVIQQEVLLLVPGYNASVAGVAASAARAATSGADDTAPVRVGVHVPESSSSFDE